MKFSVALLIVAVVAQANAIAIRPTINRPIVVRPSIQLPVQEEQEKIAPPCVVIDESELGQQEEEYQPAVIDQGQIILPVQVGGGHGQQPRPVFDQGTVIKPVQVGEGHGQQPRPVFDQGTIIKPVQTGEGFGQQPRPVFDQGTIIKPVQTGEGHGQVPRPGLDQGQLVKPVQIGGGQQILLPKPSKPAVQEVEDEEVVEVDIGGGQTVLLPVGRPLKPSDIINAGNNKPVFEGVGGTRPARPSLDVGQLIRPTPVEGGRPVVLLPNNRPLKPSDLIPGSQQQDKPAIKPIPINQQTGNGKDQFIPIRPRPVVEEPVEEEQEYEVVLLPNDRPLRPSDLIPGSQEPERPAIKPIPINQQTGNGKDQFIPIRPRPVVEEPVEEEQDYEIVLLPNDRPLRPSDLIPGSQQPERPAIKPIPINQQTGNGKDQFIPIRPRPVVEEPVEEEQEYEIILLPNDRPLKPSDLIPAAEPTRRPIIVRPKPKPVVEEQVEEEAQPIVVVRPGGVGMNWNTRPIKPVVVEQIEEEEQVQPARPIVVRPGVGLNWNVRPSAGQNWNKYPTNYLPIRPQRPVNDIIF